MNTYVLLGILGLATVLRVKGMIFQGFWFDELLTIRDTRPGTAFSDMFRLSANSNDMPPFFFVLSWGWFRLWGCTEFTGRLLPVLMGVAGVGAIYGLGQRLARPATGHIAAFLTAISTFHIYYSQELRPYSLLFLETCLSFWALMVFLDNPRPRAAAMYTGITLALLYTHYFGLLVLLAQFIVGVITMMESPAPRRAGLFRAGAVAGSTLLFGFSWWVPKMAKTLGRDSFWVQRPAADFFLTLYKDFFDFPPLAFCYAVLLGLLLVRAAGGSRPACLAEPVRFRQTLFLLLTWVLVVFLVPYAYSMNATPVTVARYFITLLPGIFLLLALSIDSIAYRPGKALLIFMIALISALGLFSHADYYHHRSKSRWRELAKALPVEERSFYLAHPTTRELFQFYLDYTGKSVPLLPAAPASFRDACLKSPPPHVFWLVDTTICDDEDIQAIRGVAAHFFRLDQTINLGEVTARRYQVKEGMERQLGALLKSPEKQWRGALTVLRRETGRKRPVMAGQASPGTDTAPEQAGEKPRRHPKHAQPAPQP